MIEINLLPGHKKKASGGGGPSFSLDDLKAAFAKVKDPALVAAVGGWVVGLLVIGFFYTNDSRRIATLVSDSTQIESEQRRFAALIAQKRKAEQLRDSLIAELNVIRGIDAERFIWPHLLEEVSRALPDFTWLTSLEVAGSGAPAGAPPPAGKAATPPPPVAAGPRFHVEGRTSDIEGYTRFLRQVANSPWITDITPGPTTTTVEQNRPVTAFSLVAQFRKADSAYIRTAPLTQTLR